MTVLKRHLIRYLPIFLCGLTTLNGQHPLLAEKSEHPLLIWHNGDQLEGQIVKADPHHLYWKPATLFEGDFQLDRTSLKEVRFPLHKVFQASEEPFIVRTISGDAIYGNIESVDDQDVVLRSSRHGRCSIRRQQIAWILNREACGILYTSPEFHRYWTSINERKPGWAKRKDPQSATTHMVDEVNLAISTKKDSTISREAIDWSETHSIARWNSPNKDNVDWVMTEDGQLITTQKNTNLVLNLPHLPETIHVSASLSWKEKGDFAFSIGLPENIKIASNLISVETWFGELALQCQDDCEPLQTIHPGSGQLTFHLRWNRQNRKVTFFNTNGKKVAEIEVSQIPEGTVPAIFIRNKTGDLSIDSVRIGGPSTKNIDFGQSAVCLVDGSRVDGEVVSYNERSGWKVKTDNGQQTIPSAAFASARFREKEPSQKTKWNSQFVYRDGSFVQGDLISIDDQVAKLVTSFTETPIECSLQDLSTIRFLGDAFIPETSTHVLFDQTNSFQGKLVSSDAGLHWCPVGSVNGLPLRDPVKNRPQIFNAHPPDESQVDRRSMPHTILLRNFEQTHCQSMEIKENTLHFNLHGEDKQVEMANIQAILFDDYGRQPIPFSDKGWERFQVNEETTGPLPGQVSHRFDLSGERISHPRLASSNDFAFELSFPAEADLVSKAIKTPSDFGKKFTIFFMISDRDYFNKIFELLGHRRLIEERKLPALQPVTIQHIGNRLSIQFGDWHGYHPVSDHGITRIQVQMDQNANQILLFLDDRLVHKLPIIPDIDLKKVNVVGLHGTGIILGNVSVAKNLVSVVDAETKDLLLTVPRVQKLDPPKHILWAKNGDFLRGTLRSLSDKKIQFESNLETFTYPLDIASRIVFLRPNKKLAKPRQKKTKPPLLKEGFVQVELYNSCSLTFTDYSIKEGHLRGSSDSIGLCKIPLSEIKKLHFDKDSRDKRFSNLDWLNKPNSKLHPTAEQDAPSK